MSTLKDIFLGPETNNPNQVVSPFAAFGAGLGSGFGKGFGGHFDPKVQQQKQKLELDKQKSNIDTAQALIKMFDIPDTKMRVEVVKNFLRNSGMKDDDPNYRMFVGIYGNDSPEATALSKRVIAGIGLTPEGLDGVNQLFRTDPTKGLEFVTKLLSGEQDKQATDIRRGISEGVSGPAIPIKAGVTETPLAPPGELAGPLSFAQQQAMGIGGVSGEKLREGLSLVSVQPERLDALLTARAAGRTTGVPAVDALSRQEATQQQASARTQPGKVSHWQTATEGGQTYQVGFDAAGNVVTRKPIGEAKGEVISHSFQTETGDQGLVLIDKASGTEKARITLGKKPLTPQELLSDFALMASGEKPKFGSAYEPTVRAPDKAREIFNDLVKADPMKLMLGEMLREPGVGVAPTSKEPKVPSIGTVSNGYRFKGGDPGLKENWIKVVK